MAHTPPKKHNPYSHNKKRRWFSIKETVILNWNNLVKRTPITEAGNPVVSLTSYGERIPSAHITIESIARGNKKPSRLCLWLDQDESQNPLPKQLKRLQKRGLEIRYAPRRGPHNKYYAYLEDSDTLDTPLVTADDDVIYPRWWLESLQDAYQSDPDQIHCFRAHQFSLVNGQPLPYGRWPECKSTTPSIVNFATGVSGVIYPPAFQREVKSQGTAFEACAPKADDVWLHALAVRGNWKIHQILPKAIHFEEVRSSRHIALHRYNVAGGGNDAQILKTYQNKELEKLQNAVNKSRQK